MTEKKTFYIGLDIGTSSVKGVLTDGEGMVVTTARAPFRYRRGAAGEVEIGAEEYIAACVSVLHSFAQSVPMGAELGMCVASASGNLLLLDADMQPAGPIYNWQDSRTKTEVGQVLTAFDRDTYYRSTGWAFDGKTFPLALLCWNRVHRPEVLDRCGAVCMSTEYLLWRLTGEWGIGTSAGTPFYLIDQETGVYRRDILSQLGIPEEKLPPVRKTGSLLGRVTAEGAAFSGLPEGTAVYIGTFDHPSAARGAGICREGQLLLSCGTSWVGFYPVEKRETALNAGMLVDPFLSEKGGPWAGMVSLASLSGQIERYTRNFVDNGPKHYLRLTELAAKSEPGAGGLKLDLLAEPDETYIRSFAPQHIARAIMENVVDMLVCRMDEIRAAGVICDEAIMVGGPSESPLWAELISARAGIPVRVQHGAYAGALGAARLAAENAEE